MQKILFLGCGKMGSILLQNIVEEKSALPSQIKVIKQSDNNCIAKIKYYKKTQDLPKNYQADLVFLAIKPQGCKEILSQFAQDKIFHKNTIFISIIAGKKIEFFEKIFSKNAKIVRSMPNLPIQYSQGIITYFCNKNIKKSELALIKKIFSKFGFSHQLTDEKLFDAATAIFGSGPAYIFLLQEIFSEISKSHKIALNEINSLIKQLFLGSALMSCNSQLEFSELRNSVTSKNGTTQAALEILQKDSSLKKLFKNAITNSVKRSQELSKE